MLDVSITRQAGIALIEVSGRVDSLNAGQMGTALSDAITHGDVHIVLDLGAVDYMSSAGLREIVMALKAVKRRSGDLRLAQPVDRVREVLEITGLAEIFQIFETRDEAIRSFQQMQL